MWPSPGLGPLRVSMDFQRGKLSFPSKSWEGLKQHGLWTKKWPSCDNRWVELTKNSCPKLLERSDAYCASLAITWGDMFLVLTSPNSEELLTGQRQNLVVATTPSSERQVFSGVPSVSMMQKKVWPFCSETRSLFPHSRCGLQGESLCKASLPCDPSLRIKTWIYLDLLQSSAHVPPKFGVLKHRMTCPS